MVDNQFTVEIFQNGRVATGIRDRYMNRAGKALYRDHHWLNLSHEVKGFLHCCRIIQQVLPPESGVYPLLLWMPCAKVRCCQIEQMHCQALFIEAIDGSQAVHTDNGTAIAGLPTGGVCHFKSSGAQMIALTLKPTRKND